MIEAFQTDIRYVTVVKKNTVGVYVDGEYMPGAETMHTAQMIIIPITLTQLKNLPEGAYQAGDMRFYYKGRSVYAPGDIFEVDGVRYMVRDIIDRSFEGNFTMYLAKRIYENA
jgi:hypothetical protein